MYLSPLDYCTQENADLAELLKSFGALTGEAVFEQRKVAAEREEIDLGELPETTAPEDTADMKDDGI